MTSTLFRSRLEKGFDSKTAKFHTSVPEDLRIFEDDINNSMAHDIMLYEQGIIPLKELKMILKSLMEIYESWNKGEITISQEFDDIHEYIEAKVIEKIGIEAGGMIHTGRSRNDQVVCDMKLRLREELLIIAEQILELIEVLQKRTEENFDTYMILYTHGQHAQIGTFSAYLSNYIEILLRDFERFMDCYKRLNTNPLGAGPVGGTSIAINRLRTTELLGFDSIQMNSIDATSSRDWAIEFASCCSLLMSNMSRIAADILEWSAIEYGYVELADEFASSSSIMPQKKNPSTLELLRGKTSEGYSALMELLTMVKGIPSGYYQDLQQTKITLWRTVDNTQACLYVMTGILSTLKVKPENMWKQVDGSFTIAVEIAETLVMDAGLSFRESYKVSAELVNTVLKKGTTLKSLTPIDVEETVQKMFNKKIIVVNSMLEKATDPKKSLDKRISLGCPHPDEIRKMHKENETKLKESTIKLTDKKTSIKDALNSLHKIAENYLKE
ncbi:argininosuccinate lyase [Candidatus Bathyarchaeota archaeon]|nr:argininosuccinate lyase [Candidatus Bathyarchaeota archaeon]